MSFLLPTIYPITDVSITKRSHLDQVKQLVDGGAKFIQLRDKDSSPRDFYESARSVMDFACQTKVKIIINDRVDIALAVKADGVHLGQDDFPPATAREILGESAIIGYSTHNLAQAIDAIQLPIDYVAIGPVFNTNTKENADAVVGIQGVKDVRQVVGDFPLVAIGGISFENYLDVLNIGINSVAIISAILYPPALISHNFRRFVKPM